MLYISENLGANQTIPVYLPKLRPAKLIYYYLEKIESTRHYSNFEPLVKCLEDWISSIFGHHGDYVFSLHTTKFITAGDGMLATNKCDDFRVLY